MSFSERYVPAALEFSKSIGGTISSESSSDRFGGFVDFPQPEQPEVRNGGGGGPPHDFQDPATGAVHSSDCNVHHFHEHNYGY